MQAMRKRPAVQGRIWPMPDSARRRLRHRQAGGKASDSECGFEVNQQGGDQAEQQGGVPKRLCLLGFAVDKDNQAAEHRPKHHLENGPCWEAILQLMQQGEAAHEHQQQADAGGDRAHAAHAGAVLLQGGAHDKAAIGEHDHKGTENMEDLIKLNGHEG